MLAYTHVRSEFVSKNEPLLQASEAQDNSRDDATDYIDLRAALDVCHFSIDEQTVSVTNLYPLICTQLVYIKNYSWIDFPCWSDLFEH